MQNENSKKLHVDVVILKRANYAKTTVNPQSTPLPVYIPTATHNICVAPQQRVCVCKHKPSALLW